MLPILQQKADQSLCKTRSLQFCNIQGPVGARSQRSPASDCSAVGSRWPLLYSKPGITRSYRPGSALGPVCCFRKLSQLWLVISARACNCRWRGNYFSGPEIPMLYEIIIMKSFVKEGVQRVWEALSLHELNHNIQILWLLKQIYSVVLCPAFSYIPNTVLFN